MKERYKPGELLELLQDRLTAMREEHSNFKDISIGGQRKLEVKWTLEFLKEMNLLVRDVPELEPVEGEAEPESKEELPLFANDGKGADAEAS